ncbi:MAG: thiol-disulfide oxidoreductase DCC family protein [Puniceicoccaceae bacterium]
MSQASQFEGLVFTDGFCNFCDYTVRYLIRNDPEHRLGFAPQQSPLAMELLSAHHYDQIVGKGVIFLSDNGASVGPPALREIARILKPKAKLLRLALWLPDFCVRPAYRLIATLRYRLFGRKATCGLVVPENLQSRLVTTR